MVHMADTAHENSPDPSCDVIKPVDVMKEEVDEEAEARNAAAYLESHVIKSSEKACEILKVSWLDSPLHCWSRDKYHQCCHVFH